MPVVGLGFTKASEPSRDDEAAREEALKDLQRVLAAFTTAEELTGAAGSTDKATDVKKETAADDAAAQVLTYTACPIQFPVYFRCPM